MMISYDTNNHFEIFGVLYFAVQIFTIYLIIINKKSNSNKIKKIAKLLNASSITIAILFLFQAINGFDGKLKFIGVIMLLFSGFIKDLLKRLKIT